MVELGENFIWLYLYSPKSQQVCPIVMIIMSFIDPHGEMTLSAFEPLSEAVGSL